MKICKLLTPIVLLIQLALTASNWEPTQQVSDPPGAVSVTQPQMIACDGFGNAAMAWIQADDVLVSYRAAGSPTWEDPFEVSTSTGNSNAVICMSETGVATVAFINTDGTNFTVNTATRFPGGSWSTASAVPSSSTTATISLLNIACRGNEIALTWVETPGVFVAYYNGTTWFTPSSVAVAAPTISPIAQFNSTTPTTPIFIAYYPAAADLQFSTVNTTGGISGSTSVGYSTIATFSAVIQFDFKINSSGFMAFMSIIDAGASGTQLPIAIIGPTGSFPGLPFIFSSADCKQPGVGIDASGRTTVIFQTVAAGAAYVLVSTNSSGLFSTWGPLETISSGTVNSVPAISVSSNGGMVAYWASGAAPGTVNLKTGFAGSFESTPTLRSSSAGFGGVCMSNSGIAYAGWFNQSTSDGFIEATRTIQALNLLEALGNKRLIFQRGLMQ